VLLGQLDLLAQLAALELRDRRGPQALLEPLVRLVPQGLRVRQVQLDLPDRPA
jgi:hypothetical protein